jgi:hypothetical protein
MNEGLQNAIRRILLEQVPKPPLVEIPVEKGREGCISRYVRSGFDERGCRSGSIW